MTLFLLTIIFSALAIAGLAWLLNRLGHSEPHRFEDAEAARRAFEQECPDRAIDEITLSTDRTAAILTLSGDGAIGLVRAMGRFIVARTVRPEEIRQVRRQGQQLRVCLRDFADPDFRITFDTDEELRRWTELLTPGVADRDA